MSCTQQAHGNISFFLGLCSLCLSHFIFYPESRDDGDNGKNTTLSSHCILYTHMDYCAKFIKFYIKRHNSVANLTVADPTGVEEFLYF